MRYFCFNFPFTETTHNTVVNQQQLTLLKKRRKLWLKVHLWLGLILGFFLALFAVTGSILVFYEEINTLLHPDLMTVSSSKQGEKSFQPFSSIMTAATATMPANATPRFINYPKEITSSYVINYRVPVANNDQPDEWQMFIDPYSAKVLGTLQVKKAEAIFPSQFIPIMFRLHFALLAGETGGIIVGIMAVIMVFSVLTGLILWWPLTGNWRRVLSIKPNASTERFNHDLHQSFGFYSFLPLLLILISGIYMNLPEQFMAVVKLLSPATESFMDNPKSSVVREAKPIGLVEALKTVRSRFPEGRLNWLSSAEGENGAYSISLINLPELSSFWSERMIYVDQYSGAILKIQDPGTRKSAEIGRAHV